MEKATEVIPQRMLSCVNAFNSLSALISKSLQEASSEPVAKASPFGKNLDKYELDRRLINKGTCLRDSVDIGLVSSECLSGLAAPNIPQFGSCITSTRYEDVLVGAKGQTRFARKYEQLGRSPTTRTLYAPHNISSVVAELYNTDTRLYVPEHAGHVTRAGDNLTIVEESATTEITGMSAQFTSTLDVASILAIQVVDRTNIVETTAGDEVSGGGVGTGHDPTRS
jgi:hypothetical protein